MFTTMNFTFRTCAYYVELLEHDPNIRLARSWGSGFKCQI